MRVARIVLAAALAAAPVILGAGVLAGVQLKTPDDWRWRLDEPAAMSPDGKMDAGRWWFVAMPPGWHITMGPGGLVYHPSYRASARFVVESELFLFPDSSGEGVGIFVGGQALGDQASPTWTALLLRKDGGATCDNAVGLETRGRGQTPRRQGRRETRVPNRGRRGDGDVPGGRRHGRLAASGGRRPRR